MKILFLDDNAARTRTFCVMNPGATCVETAADCIDRLSEKWDVVSLDHDLGGEYFVDSNRADSGMEVVRYILANLPEHLRSTEFIVHSHNEGAATEMVEALTSVGYSCTYQPFGIFT